MRKITATQILTFMALLGIIALFGLGSTWLLFWRMSLGDFRGIVLALAAVVLLYLFAFAIYRAFLWVTPLSEGFLQIGSKEEFVAQVNTLFYLLLFYPLVRSNFLPVPLMRLVYLALGARLGHNTYSGGALLDPPLICAGDNCIIGHAAVVFAHAIEGDRFGLWPVRMGHRVTIGATAVVMAGVTIGDDAIISAGAVVPKGTFIGAGEVWGGIPARCLRRPA